MKKKSEKKTPAPKMPMMPMDKKMPKPDGKGKKDKKGC